MKPSTNRTSRAAPLRADRTPSAPRPAALRRRAFTGLSLAASGGAEGDQGAGQDVGGVPGGDRGNGVTFSPDSRSRIAA